MWSAISITVPEPKLRRIPPAAFVRMSVSTPSLANTRTGSAQSDAGWPSYMWNRPLCTSTSRPASVPATSSPLWPMTVGAGKPGMSL